MDYTYDLWIDLAGARRSSALVDVDGTALTLSPGAARFTQGDALTLRLRFVDGGTTPQALPTGTLIVFAAGDGAGGLLFFCDEFTKVTDDDDIYYEGLLNLDTDEIDTLFEGEQGDDVALDVDVELQNADNSRRQTYRIGAVLVREEYSGQAEPTPGTPEYPVPSMIVQKIRGTVELPGDEDEVEVTGLGLDEAPAQVLLSLRKPSAEAPLIVCAVLGEPTDDGFTVALSAEPGIEGYKLDYLVIP